MAHPDSPRALPSSNNGGDVSSIEKPSFAVQEAGHSELETANPHSKTFTGSWPHELAPSVEVDGKARRNTIALDGTKETPELHSARLTWTSPRPQNSKATSDDYFQNTVGDFTVKQRTLPLDGESHDRSYWETPGRAVVLGSATSNNGPQKRNNYALQGDSSHEGQSGEKENAEKREIISCPGVSQPYSDGSHLVAPQITLKAGDLNQSHTPLAAETTKRSNAVLGDLGHTPSKRRGFWGSYKATRAEDLVVTPSRDELGLESSLILDEHTSSRDDGFLSNEKLVPDHFLSDLARKASDMLKECETVHSRFESLQRALRSISYDLASRESHIHESIKNLTEEARMLKNEQSEYSITISRLQKELECARKRLSEKNSLEDKLRAEVIMLNRAIESSDKERVSLKEIAKFANESIEVIKAEKGTLVGKYEDMREKVRWLEESIKEKDSSAKALDEKFRALVIDTQVLHEEMALFENEHKRLQADITIKDDYISSLKQSQDELREKADKYQQAAEQIQSYTETLQADKKNLSTLLENSQGQVDAWKARAKEKDLIISGNTEKFRELDLQANRQEAVIANLRAKTRDNVANHEQSKTELSEQVKNLERQILAAQQKSDERIQEIAEQLYHQYSKKHEVKVGQLRKNYEFKIGEKISQVNEFQKRIQNLEDQLRREVKEKEYLFNIVEKGENGTADGR